MDEDFAEEYLSKGTADEIKNRKSEFKILPEKLRDSKDELMELKELALERGYPAEEYEKVKEEAEMVAYLETKAKTEAEEAERVAKEKTESETKAKVEIKKAK